MNEEKTDEVNHPTQSRKKRIRRNEYSRFKVLCDRMRVEQRITIKELAEALGMLQKQGGKIGQGQESKLSQYETRPQGPPLEIVEQYAGYFNLDNHRKFDLFCAALEATDVIKIDMSKIQESFRDIFNKFLVGCLIGQGIQDKIKNKERIADKSCTLILSDLRTHIDDFVSYVKQEPLAYSTQISPKEEE